MILCDNESNRNNQRCYSQKRTKHIHRCFNFIRDKVKRGEIQIHKVHSDRKKLADPFTKPFSSAKHDGHARAKVFVILENGVNLICTLLVIWILMEHICPDGQQNRDGYYE